MIKICNQNLGLKLNKFKACNIRILYDKNKKVVLVMIINCGI